MPRRITCETRTSLRQRSAFLHLAVDQAWLHLPLARFLPSASHVVPLSEMSSQSREVQIYPITGEYRETAWSQELSQGMDHRMCHGLGAQTQMEGGQNLGAGIYG